MLLATWNYTNEEWRSFRQWKTRKKGKFTYFIHWLQPMKKYRVPEVRITADRVWINNVHEPFQNSRRRFMDIKIREAGNLNILEISYELENKKKGINVPIPKGKLKEAFEVQERLILDGGFSWLS